MPPPPVEIRLVSGEIAIIDADDAAEVMRYNWRYVRTGGTDLNPRRYVMAIGPAALYLHRLVMKARKGSIVDHRHEPTLDCRKSNLRFATRAENNRNRCCHATEGRTSQFKGVCRDGKTGKWLANICADRVIYRLGSFHSEEAAAQAYDDASYALHGEFGVRNFPTRTPQPMAVKSQRRLP